MLRQLLGTVLAASSLLGGVTIGIQTPLHFRLFAKYIVDFSHGEVTQMPKHLHQQISDACWKADGYQASSYGAYSSEELNYSLGNFGCKREGNQWVVWDMYKFDGVDMFDATDDRKEGGPLAFKLSNKLGNYNFKIRAKIPVYPKPNKDRQEFDRYDYSKVDLPF